MNTYNIFIEFINILNYHIKYYSHIMVYNVYIINRILNENKFKNSHMQLKFLIFLNLNSLM